MCVSSRSENSDYARMGEKWSFARPFEKFYDFRSKIAKRCTVPVRNGWGVQGAYDLSED